MGVPVNLRWVHAFFAVIALALIVGVVAVVLVEGTPGGSNVSSPQPAPTPTTAPPTLPGTDLPDPSPSDQPIAPGQTLTPCRPAERTPQKVLRPDMIHCAHADPPTATTK